jgi:hypothetical protein
VSSVAVGTGVGAVYGNWTADTTDVTVVRETGRRANATSVNQIHVYAYDVWRRINPRDLVVSGGSGAGGGGGQGQAVPGEEAPAGAREQR